MKLRLILILICFSSLATRAQYQDSFSGGEIVVGALFPAGRQQPHYNIAPSVYFNWHYDDARSYGFYTGVGFYAMSPKPVATDDISYSHFIALNLYQGAHFKLFVRENLNLMLGGEIGGKYVFYTYNIFNGGSGSLIKPYIGVSPKAGISWRPGGSFVNISLQTKYNMYFSLYGPYFQNGPEFAFIQSLNLALGFMVNF